MITLNQFCSFGRGGGPHDHGLGIGPMVLGELGAIFPSKAREGQTSPSTSSPKGGRATGFYF